MLHKTAGLLGGLLALLALSLLPGSAARTPRVVMAEIGYGKCSECVRASTDQAKPVQSAGRFMDDPRYLQNRKRLTQQDPARIRAGERCWISMNLLIALPSCGDEAPSGPGR